MIEKILERLEEEREIAYADFDKYARDYELDLDDSYDDFFHKGLARAKKIVQEVAKEYEDKASEAREEFMEIVYDELADDADNNRANRIIDAFDTLAPYQYEVAKEYGNGWIPCSSGQMPTECEEVDVTIEEIDGDVYTSTSWLQEGVWVVKKTALQPRVIAWKPKSAPYQKGE